MIVRLLMGIGAGLLVAWTALMVCLALARPKRALLTEALRLLPDVLRLLRRLAGDTSLPPGARVRRRRNHRHLGAAVGGPPSRSRGGAAPLARQPRRAGGRLATVRPAAVTAVAVTAVAVRMTRGAAAGGVASPPTCSAAADLMDRGAGQAEGRASQPLVDLGGRSGGSSHRTRLSRWRSAGYTAEARRAT